jgi:hypothetical protein
MFWRGANIIVKIDSKFYASSEARLLLGKHMDAITEAQTPLLNAVLRIRDVYPGSRIRLFSIPDPGSELSPSRIPDPRSASKNLSILTQKNQKNGF